MSDHFAVRFNGVHVNAPTNIPPGMKCAVTAMGFGKYHERLPTKWTSKANKIILSTIYIKDASQVNGGYIAAKNIPLPQPSPFKTLCREDYGLAYGGEMIFQCDPEDNLVIAHILVNNEAHDTDTMVFVHLNN